ncbi:MAG: M48 family metalloprotease [Alphaproteobacteria bacterium]|nr:M48 family metalloprotease [Alphaproteobacteria bacterium]
MINLSRFVMLVLVAAFSVMFLASFIYSIREGFHGGGMHLNIPAFINAIFWSGGAMALGLLTAFSPYGDKLAALFLSTRKTSLREEDKINPALELVKKAYKDKFGSELDLKIFVTDEPHINGMAFGRETVAVSTGLLKVAKEEEIAAILSHEAGHIHNQDGVYNLAMLVASMPTILLNYFFKLCISLGSRTRLIPSGGQDFLWVASMMLIGLSLFAFSYFVFFWAVSFLVLWALRSMDFFTQWPIEYRADKFALDMGFAPAMITLLESIEDEDIRNTSGFLSKYFYTHPPTALRIDRLERALL